jgi:hypothetical protein
MILFILQNAYRSEKHKFTNRNEWSKELLRSHTGRRLSEMIPDGYEYAVINSSPNIGDNSNSIYIADPQYIKEWVNKIKPTIIVACGRIAQKGCTELSLKYISAPHPAWRCLSKKITNEIKTKILSFI